MKKLLCYNKEKLVYESVHPKVYLIYVIILFIVFGLGWITSTNTVINKIINKRQVDTLVFHTTPFSEESLIVLLKECKIKYPHIVLAQAKLESNNFKSEAFKRNNNMFGMKRAYQRITTAQNKKDTYAVYRDWVDCVYDYAMYQSEVMCSVSSEEQYFNKLGERYAEDTMYVAKLKKMIESKKLKVIFED
jgi:uncharacterized FlgJ-related protein